MCWPRTEEIKNSPEIDTDKPVSRQKELRLHVHYGWPIYWSEPRNIGEPLPTAAPQFSEAADEAGVKQEMGKMRPITRDEVGDPHLRSMREVRGYAISAKTAKLVA